MTTKKDQFVIAVYVDNQFGVLSRVTSMFTRRGFNIDALTVGTTEHPEFSRITITMSGDGYAKAQMLNQLRKLYNVKKVEVLDEANAIERELLLIKIKNIPEEHSTILSSVDIFRAKVIDYAVDAFFVELTGSPSKIDAFIETVKPIGIVEMCRTGIVALQKGNQALIDSPDYY